MGSICPTQRHKKTKQFTPYYPFYDNYINLSDPIFPEPIQRVEVLPVSASIMDLNNIQV